MAYFDRFDICEAWDLFTALYHGGMGCELYQKRTVLSRIGYRARPSISVETLSDNAREMFDGLVSRYGFKPYFDATEECNDGSCSTCGGSGGGSDPALYCPACNGIGSQRAMNDEDPGELVDWE